MQLAPYDAGIFSIIPPLIAIILALISKEVIFSLLMGILSGTFIYSMASGLGLAGTFTVTVSLLIDRLSANSDMVIFLVMLGALLSLVIAAGGAGAYTSWASKRLKSAKSTKLAVCFLGLFLFIDDYFSCLTIGNIMRPLTDKHKTSREKLAYLIDTTAAPVSIIAPLSSWAAAVISILRGSTKIDGMQLFLLTIPMNLYALLSVFFVFYICIKPKANFGLMAKAEKRAQEDERKSENDDYPKNNKGTMADLIIPILVLIIVSVISLLRSDFGTALVLGVFCALLCCFIMYIPRRLLKLGEFFSSLCEGIKSIVPAVIILILAWTISSVCHSLLSIGPYIGSILNTSIFPMTLIPALFFMAACGLSFATGTSWGTFGILIPIVIPICEAAAPHLLIVSVSAILGGGVFGDHSSPISDSTILSSQGAKCPHMDHVNSQLPYALTVAGICFIGYIVFGITSNMGYWISTSISLGVSLILLSSILILLPRTRHT